MDKKASLEQDRQKLISDLARSFASWEVLFEFGGNDPLWEDGANMHLERNHIEYFKGELRKMCGEGLLPKLWHKPTPPEMPFKYMAQREKLIERAKTFSGEVKEMEALRGALEREDMLRVRQVFLLIATREEREEREKRRRELFERKLKEVLAFEPEPKTAGKRMEWLDDIRKIRTVTQLSLV